MISGIVNRGQNSRLLDPLIESWRWGISKGLGQLRQRLRLPLGKLQRSNRNRSENEGPKGCLAHLPKESIGIARHRSELKRVAAELEKQFLSISTTLDRLNPISDALVSQSSRLLALSTGAERGEAVLQSTIGMVREPLAFMDENGVASAEMIARLEQSSEKIERLLGMEQRIQRAVAPLRYLQTLFKIESAPLPIAVQQMFLALTEDIEKLHQQIRDTFAAKFTLLQQTRSTISGVIESLRASSAQQQLLTARKKSEIDSSLSDLEGDLKINYDRDVRLGRVSHGVADSVGRMVLNLQFQDIIHQKLQHVDAALRELEPWMAEVLAGPEDRVDGKTVRDLHDACRVQAGQLRAIRDDLLNAGGQIMESAKGIRLAVSELDDGCLRLTEVKRVTGGADGLVQVLLDAIADVRGLVSSVATDTAAIFEAIKPIRSTASNLTEVMRQLSAQIHFIAVNAEVQAASLQTGMALEVLAGGTASISHDTTQLSEEVATELDTLSGWLNDLVSEFESLHQRAKVHRDILVERGAGREKELHSYRDEMLVLLHKVGGLASDLASEASSIDQRMNFQTGAEESFRKVAEALDSIATACQVVLGPEDPQVAASRLQEGAMSRRYTMESERIVHEAALGGTAVVNAARPSGEQEGTGIELFDDFGGESAPATDGASDSTQETPPLPDANAPAEKRSTEVVATVAPAPPAPNAAAAPSLGDNIELF